MDRPAILAMPFAAAGFTAAEFLRVVGQGETGMKAGARAMQAYGASARPAADPMIDTAAGTIRPADLPRVID